MPLCAKLQKKEGPREALKLCKDTQRSEQHGMTTLECGTINVKKSDNGAEGGSQKHKREVESE